MRKGIHPEYKETTITCACGEVIHTRSTRQNIKIDICSKCHPFFTGKQKLVDTAGRVDRFKKRYAKMREKKQPKKAKGTGQGQQPRQNPKQGEASQPQT